MLLLNDDCLKKMNKIPENSVDTVITDPPYGLSKEPDVFEIMKHWMNGDDYYSEGGGFMGKKWDSFLPGPSVWKEVYRVLKPGGFALVFGGTRTFDLLTVALKMSGFLVRDTIMWIYGSGFNKVGLWKNNKKFKDKGIAEQWDGWGGSLKPAWEPIMVVMKPTDGSFADNAEKWGVAGFNIDECRVPVSDNDAENTEAKRNKNNETKKSKNSNTFERTGQFFDKNKGRWPSDLIHDGSDEVIEGFPDTKTGDLTGQPRTENNNTYGNAGNTLGNPRFHNGDSGSASRYFYCAKVSKNERNCNGKVDNKHPTVKPLSLIEYLCRLTKIINNGVVLDPFMGSGTTGVACMNTGRNFIGIEKDEEYFRIASQRIHEYKKENDIKQSIKDL